MQIKALGAAGAGGESMYIPDFWCGVVAGATGCIVLLFIIAIASTIKKRK